MSATALDRLQPPRAPHRAVRVARAVMLLAVSDGSDYQQGGPCPPGRKER